MRAIIVEFAGTDELAVVDATATEAQAHGGGATKATGALAERQRTREEYDSNEGEPW
jgi:hypothetical protein